MKQPIEQLKKLESLEYILSETDKTISIEREKFLSAKGSLESLVVEKNQTKNEIDECIRKCHHKIINGVPVLMTEEQLVKFKQHCEIGDTQLGKDKKKQDIIDKLIGMGLSLESAKVAFELKINPEAADLYREYVALNE